MERENGGDRKGGGKKCEDIVDNLSDVFSRLEGFRECFCKLKVYEFTRKG